jgi:hypothetical protein
MTSSLKALVPALVVLLAGGVAVDVSGVWRGQVTDPQGNAQELTLTLKAQGTSLMGSLSTSPDAPPFLIANGKVDGDRITFEAQRVRPSGDTLRFAFAAVVTGDRMTGTVVDPRGDTVRFALSRVVGTVAAGAASPQRPAVTETSPPHPTGPDPVAVDAQHAILAAFDRHAIVAGLGVTNKDADDFVLALVRNPAFVAKVNDIAIECGNSLYQPLLDRYTSGEEVPFDQVQQVWRNTTQPNCGFAPFYPQLVALVRRINASLSPARRLRVLACDPPIDWSKIHTRKEAAQFGDRDRTIADVVNTEALARHRKVLMPFGILHVRHGGSAARLIESKHPGAIYVVAHYMGFGDMTPLARYNALLEERVAGWPVPSVVPIAGSWLADLGSMYFNPYLAAGGRGYPGVDALLFTGRRDLLLRQPISAEVVLDQQYLEELRRRARIRGNPDGAGGPQATLDQERRAGVLLFADSSQARSGH